MYFKTALFLFICLQIALANSNRHWVYFTDKGPLNNKLMKPSQVSLSQQSLERRSIMDISLDERDLPVYQPYVTALENNGVKVYRVSRWFNAVSVISEDAMLDRIAVLPFVKSVENVRGFSGDRIVSEKPSMANIISSTDYGPSDNQIRMMGVPELHDLGYDGSDVLIAVFDTGFILEHEALQHIQPVASYDFIQNDRTVSNEKDDHPNQHNHGTMVLSVIGGYMPGQIIGPAYGADYVLAKTEDIRSETHIEEDNWVAAAEWADSLGVDIISSSLGYSIFDAGQGDYSYADMDGKTTIITRGANIAAEKGIAVFTSAGNEGNKKWRYITAPADAENVISMGGVYANGDYWPVSSQGPTADGRVKPDLVAQGASVYAVVANSENGYTYSAGTSFSCPLGAGAGALILQIKPELTALELRSLMKSTASQINNPDNLKGFGIIDLVKTTFVLKEEHQVTIKGFSVTPNAGFNSILWSSVLEIDNSLWSIWRQVGDAQAEEIHQIEGHEFSLNEQTYQFNDYDIHADQTYKYILFSNSGSGEYSKVDSSTVTSAQATANNILTSFPNPFNQITKISFSLNKTEIVSLEVFDILGRRVSRLIKDETLASDFYTLEWDGSSDAGINVSSGIYFLVLKTGGKISTHKLTLMR